MKEGHGGRHVFSLDRNEAGEISDADAVIGKIKLPELFNRV